MYNCINNKVYYCKSVCNMSGALPIYNLYVQIITTNLFFYSSVPSRLIHIVNYIARMPVDYNIIIGT